MSTPVNCKSDSLSFAVLEAIPSVLTPIASISSFAVSAERRFIDSVLRAVPTTSASRITEFAATTSPILSSIELFASASAAEERLMASPRSPVSTLVRLATSLNASTIFNMS